MWKKIVPLLIVFSVALNLAFVGIWGMQVAAPLLAAGRTHDAEVWCPLHRKLGVTWEQWQQIEPRLAEFRRKSQALCADMKRMRTELIDVIAAEQPDEQTIVAKQDEIRAGQRQMQGLVIQQLLAEKEVLTAEQQKKLFDMIRGQSGCMGPPLMQGGLGEPSHMAAGSGPADATQDDR